MPRFSDWFRLGLSQPELDFVDIELDGDMPVYVDPFAISIHDNEWAQSCNHRIVGFFQSAINAIQRRDDALAARMLSHLTEPNETRLGVSRGRPQGRGVSGKQALDLHRALASSQAAKRGVLAELGECDLFVEGIGRDKVSDITTNVIRDLLITYTQQQCNLHNISFKGTVASGRIWDDVQGRWRERYVQLPTYKTTRVILVPKHIVRRRLALESYEFYEHHALVFLQAEHLKAHSSLVETLKNGRRRVTKRRLKEEYRFNKDWLSRFSEDHPEILDDYKKNRYNQDVLERSLSISMLLEDFDESIFAQTIIDRLHQIPAGNYSAYEFHRLIVGILQFLLWPNLINPVKEKEIHDGRKRIDIYYTNAAESGVFYRAHVSPQIKAMRVVAECKNYSKDPSNPEIDQIAGRFSDARG